MDSPQQRVSVLTNDNLQRLLASQAKPVVQSVLAPPTGSRDEPQVEFSRAQHVISRSTAQFTGQVAEMGKLEDLDTLELPNSQSNNQPVSTFLGQPGGNLRE